MNRAIHCVRLGRQWCIEHPLGRSQWLALAVWLAILAGAMITLGDHIAQTTNRDVELFDQGAYLYVAERNRGAWWPTWTDGIRNPLYPWLIANTTEGDKAAIFAGSLKLNVRCGAMLMLLLGAWAGWRLPWVFAVTFASIAGIGILLPISTYAGAEVLFYGLFFAGWIQCFGLLERFTYARCALLGVTLAFAYLAKPSVTLLTGGLVFVSLIRWFAASRRSDAQGWSGLRPLIGAAMAIALFALITTPRMVNSWKQFRDPLQNTSTIYFWEENWSDAYLKLKYLNPRLIHQLPEEDRPSAKRYFTKHGWAGSWNRLANGLRRQGENFFAPHAKSLWFKRTPSPEKPVRRIFPYRGFLLLAPLGLLLGLGMVVVRRGGFSAIPEAAWCKTAFALLVTGVSVGAYSWYWVIAPGSRFILSLYVPLLASLFLSVDALRRQIGTAWADSLSIGMTLLMLGPFLVHLVQICRHPYFGPLKTAF